MMYFEEAEACSLKQHFVNMCRDSDQWLTFPQYKLKGPTCKLQSQPVCLSNNNKNSTSVDANGENILQIFSFIPQLALEDLDILIFPQCWPFHCYGNQSMDRFAQKGVFCKGHYKLSAGFQISHKFMQLSNHSSEANGMKAASLPIDGIYEIW